MTHHNASEDRRTIPGLDGRWTIDRAGQVYGPNGPIPSFTLLQATSEAHNRLGASLAAPGSLPDYVLTFTPEGEQWHADPATVEWLRWNPTTTPRTVKSTGGSLPPCTVQSTGGTMPAAGDTSRMWFKVSTGNGSAQFPSTPTRRSIRMWIKGSKGNGDPGCCVHLFHGPSVAKMTFADG